MDADFLRRQLTEARANLELIQERKAQYVLEVDVPLQLIREERRLVARIAELEAQLGLSSDGRSVDQTQDSCRSGWNTAAIREMLTAAFSDQELVSLCFDYFPAVRDDFSDGMPKSTKVQRLLDYCVRREQVQELVDLVRKHNRVQYERFERRLRG